MFRLRNFEATRLRRVPNFRGKCQIPPGPRIPHASAQRDTRIPGVGEDVPSSASARSTARATWTREVTPSFRKMLRMWDSMVFGLRKQRSGDLGVRLEGRDQACDLELAPGQRVEIRHLAPAGTRPAMDAMPEVPQLSFRGCAIPERPAVIELGRRPKELRDRLLLPIGLRERAAGKGSRESRLDPCTDAFRGCCRGQRQLGSSTRVGVKRDGRRCAICQRQRPSGARMRRRLHVRGGPSALLRLRGRAPASSESAVRASWLSSHAGSTAARRRRSALREHRRRAVGRRSRPAPRRAPSRRRQTQGYGRAGWRDRHLPLRC